MLIISSDITASYNKSTSLTVTGIACATCCYKRTTKAHMVWTLTSTDNAPPHAATHIAKGHKNKKRCFVYLEISVVKQRKTKVLPAEGFCGEARSGSRNSLKVHWLEPAICNKEKKRGGEGKRGMSQWGQGNKRASQRTWGGAIVGEKTASHTVWAGG